MSAAGTAPLSEQTGFIELTGQSAGSDARPAVAGPMRRRISAQSGRTLETLGHAIEYLADEFARQNAISSAMTAPQSQALQILMAANRSVYFECPAVPTLQQRFRGLWRAPRVLLHR